MEAARAVGWLLIVTGLVVLVREFGVHDARGVTLGWWIWGAQASRALLWVELVPGGTTGDGLVGKRVAAV